jgi:DNA/RNA-binding domain of Phe-tRNA-synthetase-like protein
LVESIAVEHRLPGWVLVWARLALLPGAAAAAGVARGEHAARARRVFAGGVPSDEPTVAAVRRLFRAAGTDPTRYRPSSEALLRRVLRGDELPAIHPLVDANNCLSITLAVPACVMPVGSFGHRVRLRRGEEGERLDSLRGGLDLAGKVLLEDERGPFGTPISDSKRVAVREGVEEAWLVTYLPSSGGPDVGSVERVLAELEGIAAVGELFVSRGSAEGELPPEKAT